MITPLTHVPLGDIHLSIIIKLNIIVFLKREDQNVTYT